MNHVHEHDKLGLSIPQEPGPTSALSFDFVFFSCFAQTSFRYVNIQLLSFWEVNPARQADPVANCWQEAHRKPVK